MKQFPHFPLNHPNGDSDGRYAIRVEAMRGNKPLWTLRFRGVPIASSISFSSLVVRAVGHRKVAEGATVIEERR